MDMDGGYRDHVTRLEQEVQRLHEKCRLITDANKRLKERLAELEEAERILNRLEAAGVDNWEWYDDSMENFDVDWNSD